MSAGSATEVSGGAADPRADEKRLAAEAAAELVTDGMTLGLGTGSTVAFLIPAVARRGLRLRCVATSPATEQLARAAGLEVMDAGGVGRLDLTIDGADQVSADRWLVKGGGGAQTREKVVAAASDRFVVIVSADKLVERIGPPVPLELLAFGLPATLEHLGALGPCRVRGVPPSPDGGVIADYLGVVGNPAELAATLEGVPGVVSHGLFASSMVSDVVVGRGDTVEWPA